MLELVDINQQTDGCRQEVVDPEYQSPEFLPGAPDHRATITKLKLPNVHPSVPLRVIVITEISLAGLNVERTHDIQLLVFLAGVLVHGESLTALRLANVYSA